MGGRGKAGRTGAGTQLGRRARRAAETRERIFRAALRLFAERGFVNTTVQDITEAADVGKGTFFNYFPSKEHVLAAFGEVQVSKVAAAVGAPDAALERPLRVTLQRMVLSLAEEPGRSPALVRALLTAILTSPSMRQLMLRHLERARTLLAEFFRAAQRQGRLRRDQRPEELAHAMQRMFFGTMFMWAVDPSGDLKDRFIQSLELSWGGMQSQAKRS
jgi:AcrR family transcriptional regulator